MFNEIFMIEHRSDDQKVELKDVKLRKDEHWGYYLDVTYQIETPEEIK